MARRAVGWGVTLAVFVGVWLFWWLLYPHALAYQEQYQLFLWTGDYLTERLSTPGGLADWLGEFVVQFYYWPWLGALLLGLLFAAVQRATLFLTKAIGLLGSLVLPLALLWLMGDPSVLLSLAWAVLLSIVAGRCLRRMPWWGDILVTPILYWLVGPAVWLYVVGRVVSAGWHRLWLPVLMLGAQLSAYAFFLPQWPLPCVMLGQNYYRIPLHLPSLSGYDKEMYELIWQDWKVRERAWDDIVGRAQKYQVRTAFSSVCVNLALAEKRQLADRMFDFYQSGEDALVMPRVRDLTSMLPTAEVFWHLGMVNAAQRYMFDTQESILNGRRSGRCTKRIAECQIVNGHYKAARKQIDLLKKSLFYRAWAEEAGLLLGSEVAVNSHPEYGQKRRLRYRENYLFSYAEIDKMLGLLFMNNHDNRMALDYFMGQMLLKGEVQGFVQYMQWVQQYGGYRQMPLGYQDAMLCIQRQGNVPGSPYANYAKRMMAERRTAE